MKNKEKYNLRDLNVKVYDDMVGGLMLIVHLEDKHVYTTPYSKGYVAMEKLFEWLEEEYKEPIKLSDDEKAILRSIPKEFKWICRDEGDKGLYVYTEKPSRDNICKLWYVKEPEYGRPLELFKHLFQFIKWEDEEPYNIEELLKDD